MKNKFRKKCLCCGKKNLIEIINLGDHSFADRFIPFKKSGLRDPRFPLILDLCKVCSFIQTRAITNPKARYLGMDYSYTSSNSKYARTHWINFAKIFNKKINLKNKKIIEIGSNDGFLLSQLKMMGAKVLGVDASNFMVNLSKRRKIDAVHSIFDFKESKKIKKKFGIADIVIANNVFNHSNKPQEFLKGVYNLLNGKGMFIFEQPNFTKGLATLKFDQIYHEHVSYLTAKNINSILSRNKFKIFEMTKNDYHGGSIRTIAIKKKNKLISLNIKSLINYEKNKNFYNLNYYKKIMKQISIKKKKLISKIDKLINKNYTIIGIGAGAKSNTFLTYYELGRDRIKFLTDSSIYKQNKLTPVTRIPIKDDNVVKKFDKIACIILSWNISKIVVSKIKRLNKNAKILYT